MSNGIRTEVVRATIRAMSTAYPVPGSERTYPAPRYPDLKVRVVPNESLADRWPHLGELVQSIVELDADYNFSVELDTSDRTKPGEPRGGASPQPVLSLVLFDAAAEAVVSALLRVAVEWVRRHFRRRGIEDEPVIVRIYAPSGDVLSEVQVTRAGTDIDASSH